MNSVRLLCAVKDKFRVFQKNGKNYSTGTVMFSRPGNNGGHDTIPVIVCGDSAPDMADTEPGCLVHIKNAYLQNRSWEEQGASFRQTEVVAFSAAVILDPPAEGDDYNSLMDNSIILIGRWSRDPELRYSTGQTAVCNCAIAVDHPGNSQGKADFFPVILFKKMAESVSRYTGKGQQIALEGRIRVRSYEKDGLTKKVTEIIASRVEFLSKPRGNGSAGSAGGGRAREEHEEIPFGDDDMPF